MLIDSHVHFDAYADELTLVLERTDRVGVKGMVAIGGTAFANKLAVQLAKNYPGKIWATVGYDRNQAQTEYSLGELTAWVKDRAVAGIGEIGLDYHYLPDTAASQKKLFEDMLTMAAEHAKPVVVHSREANKDTLAILKNFVSCWPSGSRSPGVLHCFTGTKEFAEEVLELGFMIGFSGIITFKSAGDLREVARFVPNDRVLIETDSPYLAPVPYRGGKNEPAFVIEVARALALLKGMKMEEVARVTARNALALFERDGKDLAV